MTEPHEPENAHEPGEPTAPDHGWAPVDPPTEPGWRSPDGGPTPDGTPPRRSGWRSRGLRLGLAGTLAALVLLGGGAGIGYAVADSAHPAAAHAAAGKARPGKGGAAAGRQRRGERGCTTPPAAGAPGHPASAATT